MASCQQARVGVLIACDILIILFLIVILATTDLDQITDPTKVRLGVTIAVLCLLNLVFFFKYCRVRGNELVQGPPPQIGIYAIDPDVAHRPGHPNVNDHVIFTPANHQRFNQVDVVGRVEVFTWAVVDPAPGQLPPPSYDPPPAYKDLAPASAPATTNENGERPQDSSISGWDVCY